MKWQKLVLLAELLIAHTLLALLFQSVLSNVEQGTQTNEFLSVCLTWKS